MVTKCVIVALGLLAMVNRSLALSCIPCDQVDCGPSPTCSYEVIKGVCNCCDACAKGPGERCGGPWGVFGTCSVNLECQLNHNIPGPDINKDGICADKPQIEKRLLNDLPAQDYYDYNYDDYEGKRSYPQDYANLELPKFAVEEQIYTVQEGRDVTISCAVSGATQRMRAYQNLAPYIPSVKKVGGEDKEQLLFIGDVKIATNNKYEFNNGIMTIRNVNRNEAGDYTCYLEAEPAVEITHKLDVVQYSPTISSPTPKNPRLTKEDSLSGLLFPGTLHNLRSLHPRRAVSEADTNAEVDAVV